MGGIGHLSSVKVICGEVSIDGSHGTDDPTRATFPFFLAKGALDAGHEASITLMMDSVVVMKDDIAKNIQDVGLPPLKELMGFAVAKKIPIYV